MTETKISKQAIRVYAALNALKGSEDGDVIDALLPFIMPVLNLSRGKILSTELLVLGLGKLYGWRITHDIAEKFQDRLCAKGFLVKSSQPNHAVSYFCNPPAEPPPSTENISFANSLSEVIDEFVTFAPTLSSLFVKERERDNLEETLVKFLVSLDVYTDDALLSQLRKMKSSDEIDDQSKKLVDGIGTLTDEDRYLCARFIEKMYKDKSPLLQHLSKIAAVGLLAEVVSDFIKPTTNVLKSDLVVVLDAPLAMNALGTSGNFAKDEISTLIAALKSVGCQVIVLSTSCKEISRNLHTMLKEERGNRWGPTHRAMVKGEVGEDFVRLVIADPEKALISTGIQVRKVDLSDPMIGLKYFTKDMLEDFKLGIQWKSLDARDHDAECVASIMRFRNGIHRKDPMDCTHVFVTGNNRLALYARKYCLHNQSINQNACGPVLALQDIATIAWLRTGFGEAEALPRKHMLAACEKVLAVQKSVVTKVTEELGKVSPNRIEQLQLLLLDQRSSTRLMDHTAGNPDRIASDNVEQLMDEMLRSTAKDVEEEYKQKLKLERGRSKNLTAQIESSTTENTRTRDELNKLKARETERIQKIIADVNGDTKLFFRTTFVAVAAIAFIAFIDQFRLLPEGQSNFQNAIKVISALFFVVATYYMLMDFIGWKKFVLSTFLGRRAIRKVREMMRINGLEIDENLDDLVVDGDFVKLSSRSKN